jgi:hypothetical protein
VVSSRRRLLIGLALVVVAAVAAVTLLARDDKPKHVGLPVGDEGLSARTSITPRGQLFGDSAVARLDVLVDRDVVDPATVTIWTNFAPYRQASSIGRERIDYDRVTRLRYSVALECLDDDCAPRATRKQVRFAPAQVRVKGRVVQRPRWPELTIGSRLQNPTSDPGSDVRNQRVREPTTGLDWRAEVRVQPPTWRIGPTQLTVTLVAFALVLLAMSFFLLTIAYPGLARRLWRRPARLSPLEHALGLVQRASERGVEEDHRVALDDLATELRAVGAGELAGTAYALAWNAPPPGAAETEGLSSRVRELIEGSTNGRP